MKLTNVKIMFPFCRTLEEADDVIKVLREEDLQRGRNSLELYCMAEVPSNIILADEFAKRFDGFSIGSNDLTQLILGIDRDSELLAHLFDERNEAVKRAIAELIQTAHLAKPRVKVGICGQSPSDFEEIRIFLVENGIDSMSLNPDTVIQGYIDVAKVEKRLRSSGKRASKKGAKRKR
jgi:pyruvate,water dikinase